MVTEAIVFYKERVMLRANVGLSRKLSKDYNSTGFTVNLDGEITAPTSDPEAVIEQVKELFDLAEEALSQQIDRTQSDAAIASRDEEPQPSAPASRNGLGSNGSKGNRQTNGTNRIKDEKPTSPSQNGTGNGREDQPATNRQVQYLLTLSKRQKLSTVQLEKKIADILGRPVGVYDLSKMAAGIVIDVLSSSNEASANGTNSR
jgi:hypothetical protein